MAYTLALWDPYSLPDLEYIFQVVSARTQQIMKTMHTAGFHPGSNHLNKLEDTVVPLTSSIYKETRGICFAALTIDVYTVEIEKTRGRSLRMLGR